MPHERSSHGLTSCIPKRPICGGRYTSSFYSAMSMGKLQPVSASVLSWGRNMRRFLSRNGLPLKRASAACTDLPASNSELYQMLADFQIELILYMMAITDHETIKKMISHYVTDLREVKLSVGGKDLKALGVAPSPVYGKILNAVHEAKLDKKIETREEELALLKEYAARY